MTKLLNCFIVSLLIAMYCFVFPSTVSAAKKRVWGNTGAKQTTTSTTGSNRPIYSPKLRSDRQALIITFGNLSTTSSVSYELTYTADSLDQGVFGSVLQSDGNATTRTLYFGTCSKGVCTPHKNITEMRLVITAKLKSGQILIKSYRIKP